MVEVIVVVAVSQQHQIGLRLGIGIGRHRILHLHQRPAGETFDVEGGVQPQYARRVAIANGRHDDDLTSQQLDALIPAEDAGPAHGLILFAGEAPPSAGGRGARCGMRLGPGRNHGPDSNTK